MANERQFAGSIFKIDGTLIAKVRSFRFSGSANEKDVTGAEDESGGIADKQYLTTSKEKTVEIEGIEIAGSGAHLEPGQTALRAAYEAGSSITFREENADGYGTDYTCVVTQYNRSGAVDDVFEFTANFRVNAESAVTP